MFVAWIEPPSLVLQGDQIYRTRQPAHDLACMHGHHVITGSYLSPTMHQAAQAADVLFLCQAVDPDFVPLLQRRRRAGLTTLYEINDNFCDPRSWGEVGNFYHQPEIQRLIRQLCRLSDGLVFSTPWLAEKFGPWHDHHITLPNAAIGTVQPFKNKTIQQQPIRLGWGGSAGHYDDWVAYLPALEQLLLKRRDISLAIMAPTSLHALFSPLPKDRCELRPAGDLTSYRAFLATLDVGLAPICHTSFGCGRSDVKVIEYTQAGVATVASTGPAYAEVLAAKAALPSDGPTHMMAQAEVLLDNLAMRRSFVTAAQTWVRQQRSSIKLAQRRHEFLVARAASKKQRFLDAAKRWENISQQVNAAISSDTAQDATVLHVEPQKIERFLYAGLSTRSQVQQKSDYFKEATKLSSNFYLPLLYLATNTSDRLSRMMLLQKAIALAPDSAACTQALARCHIEAGNFKDAYTLASNFTTTYDACTELSHIEAHCLEQFGNMDGAVAVLRRAVAQASDCRQSNLLLADALLTLCDKGSVCAQTKQVILDEAQYVLAPLLEDPCFLWQARLIAARLSQHKGDWSGVHRLLAGCLGSIAMSNALQQPVWALFAQSCLATGDRLGAQKALQRLQGR